ncbi:uncharacterized protein LOC118281504 isoform X2 [Spodoptera frugiperda]|uniref:Uncharacterized protein LOC118281504 isoform X2 n=1 Tax=Spodoptera frugiperda TaxID=7108 RepID=A0A9R0DK64_SPOFR|nr:uncharacterized protein LOC118281504 isoform X2 [Spodoptera frugiperda]
MADTLKTLLRKRSSLKSKLTIYSNYLSLIKSSAQISGLQRLDLQERFNKFDSLHSQFDELQTEIELLADDAETAFVEREDFDRQFFNLVALTRSLLGSSVNGAGSEAGFKDADSGAHVSNSFVRLPKIDLPHFDGNYQCWLEFRDTFTSLIHDNASINNINKFHYLRASLQGTAASLIKNIEFRSDHYMIAWDLLCERYNNEYLLVANHLQALFFDVKSVSRESSVSIRSLVDVINRNIRALANLKRPTQHWDDIIIFVMVKKLDLITSREWEEYRNNNIEGYPTITQFCSFLNRKADWLESVECNIINNIQDSNIVALNSNIKLNKNNSIKPKNSNQINKNSKCPLCSQVHTLYKCEFFRNLSIENRIQKAKDLTVCLNCLRTGHSAKHCKFSNCRYCKFKHNTLLHLESSEPKPLSNPLPSALLSASPSTSDVALSANSMQLATSSHVFLSTALVNVTSATGKKYTARLLLDNGSTANFVTQSLAEKLGLSQRGMSTKAKSKWFHSRGEVKPGSLVLIKDKTTPPLLWSLGRVTKTYPGVDGVTRVVELKTRRGTIRRAFNCICPLPIENV